MENDFNDLYIQYTNINKYNLNKQYSDITTYASGSKNVLDEITYYNTLWKLHVNSVFTFSWDSSGNITISNASYSAYSDSTPVISCNRNPWHNGQTDATIS